MSYEGPERRTAPRQKSFLQGRAFYNQRRSSADCIVRDITESGARLTFSGPVALPEVFELHIPNKGEVYRVHVQWHHGKEMGVSLGHAENSAPDEPNVASPSIVSPAATVEDRLHRLEREIAALRRRLDEIQRQDS